MLEQDKEREFGLRLIDGAEYGVLSVVDRDNMPYGIPLSIVRDGDNLYFHSAKEGKKVEIFANNPRVSLSFVKEVKIPDIYSQEELKEMKKDKSKVDLLIDNVFTTEFKSAIVGGQLSKTDDEGEKARIFRLICEKYTPSKMAYADMAIEAGSKTANIYRIKIDSITIKGKKYDKSGRAVKWGKKK